MPDTVPRARGTARTACKLPARRNGIASPELQSTPPGYQTMAQAHYINNPHHWRARAQEMRVLAEDLTDDHSRQTMLQLAKDYDHLAERAEKRSNGTLH